MYVISQFGTVTILHVISQFGTSTMLYVISQFGELGVGVGVLVGIGVGVGPNTFGTIFNPPENCIPIVLYK